MIKIPRFNVSSDKWIQNKQLHGKLLSEIIIHQLKEFISHHDTIGKKPGLVAIRVGSDEASKVYVSRKEKAALNAGFYSKVDVLPAETTEQQLLDKIKFYNQQPNIHGILVQLPLPSHIHSTTILESIHYSKDADGFHDMNSGKLFNKKRSTIPCTPLGIMVMLQELNIPLESKNAVVLGRSNIVGKPIAQLLLDYANCTVTICNSKTKNLNFYIQNADIIVSAMGRRNMIDETKISKDAIVIDVGIHRENNKLKGDLNLSSLKSAPVSYYTPVPGGVGPMTIAMLLYNTYQNFTTIEGIKNGIEEIV